MSSNNSIEDFLANITSPQNPQPQREQQIPDDVRDIVSELYEDLGISAVQTAGEEQLQQAIDELNSQLDQPEVVTNGPLPAIDDEEDSDMSTVAEETENTVSSEAPLEAIPGEANVYDNTGDNTSRFSGAVWFNTVKNLKCSIVGVGGIGSYVALLLSRLQPDKINLIDPDVIDNSNMSGQLYNVYQVGLPKVEGVLEIVRRFSNYYGASIYQQRLTFENIYLLSPVTFCGLDNMASRKECYQAWKHRFANRPLANQCLFIDGRLSMEEFQIFCIPGDDRERQDLYEKEWLFSSEDAEETVCSLKQTSYMAAMIGGMMVDLAVNYFSNLTLGFEARPVPFFTSYSGPCVYLKTE